jgi:hypothetical protein
MFEQLEELHLCEVSSLSEDALQTTLKGLAEDEVPKSEGFQVSIEEASSARLYFGVSHPGVFITSIIVVIIIISYCQSNTPIFIALTSARTGKFRLQRLKIFSCNNHLNAHITTIAQFLNLPSLGFSSVVNNKLTPLRNLKHLGNLVLKTFKFNCATELLTFISNQPNCLNIVDVSGTDCNFISVNCQPLSCLRLCFEEVGELCLSCEYHQAVQVTLPVPNLPSFGSLQLFLSDSHATDYNVTGCKHLRILNIKSRFPDIRIFVYGIIERKNLIHLEEVLWKDVVVMCSQKECCMFKFHSDGETVRYMGKK